MISSEPLSITGGDKYLIDWIILQNTDNEANCYKNSLYFRLEYDKIYQKKYGINTNGLTEKQIKDKVAVKEHEDLISIAKEYDIDTNGLSDEQIKEKVFTKQNEKIIAKAKNAGIDTDGLTTEQVIAKVNERDKKLKLTGIVQSEGNDSLTDKQIKYKEKCLLLEKAKRFGIDTKGLTDKQLTEKVTAKENDIKADNTADGLTAEQRKYKEKCLILEKAKRYSIDINGLTDVQIVEKITARENEVKANKATADGLTPEQRKYKEKCLLLEKAKKLGIDTNGLTDKQLEETVTAKENEIKGDKANMAKGLTSDQAGKKASEKDIEQKKQREEAEKKFMFDEAKRFNIDTTGLSYEQIIEKVHEKWLPELVEKAKELGIDSTGLNYNQLLLKIKARECEISR